MENIERSSDSKDAITMFKEEFGVTNGMPFGEAVDTAISCKKEIDRLADFILANMPEEIGKGNPQYGESAVDIAIRLLSA